MAFFDVIASWSSRSSAQLLSAGLTCCALSGCLIENRTTTYQLVSQSPIALTPSGPNSSSGRTFVYVSGYDPLIRVFQLDLGAGALTPTSTASGGNSPSYLAWDPSKRFMYAVQETTPGRISAYAINPADGSLTPLNDASSGGGGPAHLSVHPSGKWVLSSNYGNGAVAVLPIQANGGVGEPIQTLSAANQNAHMMMSDPSGQFVFVPCTGPNLIAQFLIDATSGHLSSNNPATVPGGAANAQPRHLAFHPSLPVLYVINEAGSSVTTFHFDSSSGRLSNPMTVSTLPSGVNVSNTGAHVAVHPNGKFVYASNRGYDSIAIFSVNPATGQLTQIDNETGNGTIKTPRDFSLDPSGRILLVANQANNTVAVFHVDASTGKLALAGAPISVPTPTFVGVLSLP